MSDKKDKGEIVDLTVRVEVYPTEKAPYHQAEYEAGQTIKVAPKVAEKMKKFGWASDTPPSKKKSGKDDL